MSTKHYKGFSVVDGDITVDVDLSRVDGNLDRAQFWLDSQVMTDMVPYMPMVSGNFIQRTLAISTAWAGTGKVCAGAGPFGRFLYEGKVMVDPETGSPWARKDAKKVVTDKPLQYTTTFHSDVQDHWFEPAKAAHGDAWVAGAKRIGGGNV